MISITQCQPRSLGEFAASPVARQGTPRKGGGRGTAVSIRLAVAGLKHDHVRTVIGLAQADPAVELVGLADDDPANRLAYEDAFGVPVRYTSHRELLESLEFEVLVVCEAFGRRGEVVCEALLAGKHVFCDKPLCVSEEELWRVATAAREGNRELGLDLSLRHWWARTGPPLQQGEIGGIVSCVFAGPHALGYGSRPRWYFEPGNHGGIINDLMGHGVDYVRWVTGRPATHVLSATQACVGAPQEPRFQTLGEAHYLLAEGATVFGHVNYLAPAAHPAGWRFVFTGTEGDAIVDERGMCLRRAGRPDKRVAPGSPEPGRRHPFSDFLQYLSDGSPPLRTTAEALECSLATLVAQRAADTGEARTPIPHIAGPPE
jgi:predicted dehydrogenase